MGVQQFTPSNDVELSIFTTEPAWSTEEINTNIKTSKEEVYWNTLKFLKRDLRLGNLNPKRDDLEWCENQVQLTQNLLSLRKGRFSSLAPDAIIRVIGKIELSHSVNGMMRNWFRTFSINTKEESNTAKGGLISNLFGKNKQGGY
jgi:hypothetical protein